jgi:type I restriction enzyme, S subunit
MNRYETYKDSGIPWLGEVPEHWEIVPIRYLFQFKNNLRIPLSAEERGKIIDKIYPYYGASGIIDYVDNFIFDEDLILVAEDGANLLSRSTPLAFIAAGKYWVNNHAHILKPLSHIIKFWQYLLQIYDFLPLISGSAQPKLTKDNLASILLPTPPVEEQTAIAHYLDTKLGEIDALIDKQQTLLEKLAEQRTAVITHAVTKGLNHAAAMKNSGVEWVGDVPAHWDVKRLKNSINCSKNGIWGDEEKFDENDMYCLRVADFNRTNFTISETNLTIRNINSKDYENRKLKKGDLLLEKSGGGDKQPVGFVVLNTVARKSVCSNFIAQLKLAENMNAQFWVYFHQFLYSLRINVRSIKQSIGIQNLDETLYFNELACYPPFKEQTAIADYLDQETAKIDRLCDTVNQTIGRLKEYRTALITQAVTGKIKVTDE